MFKNDDNYNKHGFKTKAIVKTIGTASEEQYRQIADAFNKIPDSHKKNIKKIDIRFFNNDDEWVFGEWEKDIGKISIGIHSSFEQVTYDGFTRHEVAHSMWTNERTLKQKAEWKRRTAKYPKVSDYTVHWYGRYCKEKQMLDALEQMLKNYEQQEGLKNFDQQEGLENYERGKKQVADFKDAFFSEMHSEAYAYLHAPDNKARINNTPKCTDLEHREEVIKIFKDMFGDGLE